MRRCLFYAIVLASGLWCLATAQGQQQPQPLKLVQTIPLGNVEGRLGNKTVEVIDLTARKSVRTIRGLKKPQGLLYVPESNLLFVADGDQAATHVYDGSSYKLIRSESDLKDADGVAYDARSANTYGVGLVHVGYGSGTEAGIIAMESKTSKVMFEIPVDGHPESIQFLKAVNRMYVSVPRLVTLLWRIQAGAASATNGSCRGLKTFPIFHG